MQSIFGSRLMPAVANSSITSRRPVLEANASASWRPGLSVQAPCSNNTRTAFALPAKTARCNGGGSPALMSAPAFNSNSMALVSPLKAAVCSGCLQVSTFPVNKARLYLQKRFNILILILPKPASLENSPAQRFILMHHQSFAEHSTRDLSRFRYCSARGRVVMRRRSVPGPAVP